MSAGNALAGILEGLGKAISGYGMANLEQKNKLALQEKANEPYMQMFGGMGGVTPAKTVMSDQDKQALACAMANRSDPRAQAILKKLGVGM